MNPNYDSTIGVWFSFIASSMIIGAAFVTGIVMFKETRKINSEVGSAECWADGS